MELDISGLASKPNLFQQTMGKNHFTLTKWFQLTLKIYVLFLKQNQIEELNKPIEIVIFS